jgi:mono/diheme cytochrome c family protein
LGTSERRQPYRFIEFPDCSDGQRLFAQLFNLRLLCLSQAPMKSCWVISKGGNISNIPAWKELLTPGDRLALGIGRSGGAPESQADFQQLCSPCHGQLVPRAENVDAARALIESGGVHRTMPVWGEVLTSEQLDALVKFTKQSSQGNSVVVGQKLFSENCTACHGSLGEGGPNPARPGDIIAPISSAEYLKTRDDATLKAIISQGQPNFGMSPFGSSNGGPLDQEDIEAIVNFIRSWEAKPPVDQPPEVSTPTPVIESTQTPSPGPETGSPSFSANVLPIFAAKCALCHGTLGGWNSKDYVTVMQSGDNSPVILAGDPQGSLLVQKLLGTQTVGGVMPPGIPLTQEEIDLIIAWIEAGAPDN